MEIDAVPDTSGAAAQSDQQSADQKKRNRIRFSCTTCREKKLKCNRASPCDQCEKRGITSTCEYIPYVNPRPSDAASATGLSPARASTRPKQAGNESTLQARLRHLERLVQVLKSRGKDVDGESQDVPDAIDAVSGLVDEPTCTEFKETAGPIVDDVRYLHGANWEGVLDEITKLTDNLKTFDDSPDPSELRSEIPPSAHRGPVLLLGSFPSVGTPDMLNLLPPRLVTDRIIARFFAGKEPAWVVFHVPSFLQEYDDFWKNPRQVSLSYLGLLFAMISHAALFCLRGDEEVPGNLGNALHVADTFRLRSAQCLALDDYTRPGKYKVEALLLYFGGEFLRQNDVPLGNSMLLSILMRLAMHMGYHRDPKHYKEISPFEGEMRRRKWTLLTEVDALVSFQFGLPGNIQRQYYDTEPPRNLYDEDFDESTIVLPPSRPETERTPALYMIVKGRVMQVFTDILQVTSLRHTTPYTKIMQLDKQLEAAHDSFPPQYRMRSFGRSVVDPIDLVMQRYWLELLYQKARSVLHRKYLGVARLHPAFKYSRWACIDAAMTLLKHQYDIHLELQPGGRLSKDRWFISSLSTHDFLLADMILCLELSQALRDEKSTEVKQPPEADGERLAVSKEQLLEALKSSRSIWQVDRNQSAEASRAFKILTRMLSLSTGTEYESSPESIGHIPDPPDLRLLATTRAGSQQDSTVGSFLSGSGLFTTPATEISSTDASPPTWGQSTGIVGDGQIFADWTSTLPLQGTGELSVLDSSEGLVDPSLNGDWSIWDNQIQNPAVEMPQIPWNNFFDSTGQRM